MLRYAVLFFVIALVAALFGFSGIAASAIGLGQLLFYGFVVVAVVGILAGVIRRH